MGVGDKVKFSRRQFLKATCVAGTAAVTGCSDPARILIPYVIPPEDIVPGEATWYATTCRECPAGCGILAKNRDGRVIKVEGNPLHPVNKGKLCARGQASIQGIYNPDRYRGPMLRGSDNKLLPISWEKAENILLDALLSREAKGRPQSIVVLTDLVTGTESTLITRWINAFGSGRHVMYEPLAYEALRKANQVIFGEDALPGYRIDKADLLISFGAGFLETWISNVQFARQFAAFHEAGPADKHFFAFVGPRLSMTATNADQWIPVPPGGESLVALGLLRLILEKEQAPGLTPGQKAALRSSLGPFTPDVVEKATGVKPETLTMLAARFARARKPLVLAEGMTYQDPVAFETAVAANLLCSLKPGSLETFDFSDPPSLSRVATAEQMRLLVDAMQNGEVEVLLAGRANPLFHLPPSWHVEKALRKVPMFVSLSSFPDETAGLARLILPTHTFLESWGDYSPQRSVSSLLQPVMGPVFDTRHLGDILLSTGKRLNEQVFPEPEFYQAVRSTWAGRAGNGKGATLPESDWQEGLRKGGAWQESPGETSRPVVFPGRFSFSRPDPAQYRIETGRFSFISYPTVQFFDGRAANRPFLQEMPDPVTMITWAGWVEINPETAQKLNIAKGDLLLVRSDSGTLQAAAYPYPGILPGTLAMPLGHGHTAFGRYARNETGNPVQLSSGALDPAGGLLLTIRSVVVQKEGRSLPIANTDGSGYQHGRNLARSITWRTYRATAQGKPEVVLPLPEGFDANHDFYPPHAHDAYRWIMVVDLDRCIGCQACVIACYAENNLGVVGKENVLKGREMSWIHIERYFEPEQPFVRFLPMLCQHCEEAPCESVCPVFAPHHSKEGLNNQVYNRCIGSRYCNQNCPWKVRRFNWFTWKHENPLEWQLNPDVTVRTKGVMEKCSFCIQRIVAAKITARNEGRLVGDGEFTTACAQTCPTDALVFGNLKDPESRVSKLIRQPRAYQVLGQVNTKPAVIYLKKITRELML